MAQGKRAGAEHSPQLQHSARVEHQRSGLDADGAAAAAAGASTDKDAAEAEVSDSFSDVFAAAFCQHRQRQDGRFGPDSTPAEHVPGPAPHAHRIQVDTGSRCRLKQS